jgi:two-component system, chemotaxis family, chemotaxis protein CheY
MPDTILLDWHMPAIGQSNGGKPLVIYCATENNARDIALALSSGADDYLLKPFDRAAIRAKLVAAGLA